MKAKTRLIIGIIAAVIIAAVGITVTVLVTNTLQSQQEAVVRNATDLRAAMDRDLDGKTIVFANDISVDGNLDMTELSDIDLNGHKLTVSGAFKITSEASSSMKLESTESGGAVYAGSIAIGAKNAHVVWNSDVSIADNGTFVVRTSDSSFIFGGKFLKSDGKAAETASITALGGKVSVESKQEGVVYKVYVTSNAADNVKIENKAHETSKVEIVTDKSVAVAGEVVVSTTESSSNVAITADSGSKVEVGGNVSSVSAPGSTVVVSDNAVVSGKVEADSVTNNGSVGEVKATGDVVNSGTVTGKIETEGKLENSGTVTGNVVADKVENKPEASIGGNVTAGEVENNGEIKGEIEYTEARPVVKPTVGTKAFTYDGEKHTVTVPASADYELTGTYEATNAGSYQFKIVLKDKVNTRWADKTTDDIVVDWTIDKADITLGVTLAGWTYGGTAKTPAVTGNTGNGAVTYEYKVKDAADGTYSATVPTNAGAYTVRANVAATANYNAGSATANFTIDKADITLGVTLAGWTYGDNANTPAVTGNTGNGAVTYEYKVKDAADGTYSATVPTNAGDYTVRASVAATANYNAGSATASFTIAKAEVTVPTADESKFTYNGSEQTYEVKGVTAAMNIEGNKKTDAGEYKVKVSLKNPGNHVWSTGGVDDIEFDFVIAEAVVSVPTPASDKLTYTGAEQTLDVPENAGYTISDNKATNVGDYKAILTLNKNYIWKDGSTAAAEIPWQIEKAKNSLTTEFKMDGYVFGQDPPAPTAPVSKFGTSAVKYYADKDCTIEATLDNKTPVGTYYAKVTVDGTDNYEEFSKIYEIKVASATVKAPEFTAPKLIYNGKEQGVTIAADEGYTISSNKATNAGNYKVTLTLNDNYIWADNTTEPKTYDWTIAKATYDMTNAKWDYTDAFTYDGTAKTVSVTGLPAGVAVKAYSGSEKTDAGDYTASVTLSYDEVNYNAPSLGDLEWAIEAKEIVIDWTADDFTYNGTDRKSGVTASYKDVDGNDVKLTLTLDGEFKNYRAGGYTFTAAFANGESNYKLPADVTKVYNIKKLAVSIVANDGSMTYGDNVPALSWSYAAGSNEFIEADNVEFTVTTDATAASDVGDTYHTVITKKSLDNYQVTYADGKFTVEKRALTVTIDDKESVYGDAKAGLTATVTAGTIVNGDKDVYGLTTDASATAATGNYAVTGKTLNDNYDITFVAGNYVITDADITDVSVNGYTGTYDGAEHDAVIGNKSATTVNDQTAAWTYSATQDGTYSADMPAYKNAGTYTVYYTVSAPNHNDYRGSFTVTIAKADITVTIDNKSSAHGETPAELTAKITSGELFDAATDVYTLSTTATSESETGIYDITGESKNDNYNITFVNGTYTITVGAVTVTTADALIDAIADSGYSTVKLGADITVNVTVAAGRTVTLDLNGYTLKSNTAAKATIENNGSLTVVDTGSAKGKITRGSTNWHVIVNEGEMTLNGIVVENANSSDSSSLIINNKDCVAASPANLTIESGTFASAGSNAVKNDDYGVLTVNGGTFTTDGAKVAAIQNWATATINGGDFSGFKQAIAVQVYGGQTNTTLITDGKFGTPAAIYIGNGFEEQSLSKGTINLKITGGTFNGNVTTSSVNTILPTDKIDLGTYAGEIVLYADSEGSLKAATAFNAKVVLVKDITLTEAISIDKAVTLDLNGKTIYVKLNGVTKENGAIALKAAANGKLTIKGNGTIDARNGGENYEYVVPVGATSGGEVVIENGTIIVDTKCESCVYVMNGGKVTINGGTFRNESTEEYAHGGGVPLTINVQNGTSQVTDIVVKGGTFVGRNPADGDDNLGGTFLAVGYISTVTDANGVKTYTVYESLAAAIAVNDVVTLASEVTLSEVIKINKDLTLNLNNYVITVASTMTESCAVLRVESGTLTINGEGTITAVDAGDKVIPVGAMGGNVIINGGEIVVDTNLESCVYAMYGGKVTINGGTFRNESTEEYAYENHGAPLTLNVSNSASVTDIVVKGGTFVGRNPADGDDNLGGTFLADGFVSAYDEATKSWTVRAADVWDGSVDTSWYTEGQTEFTLTSSAQLAGLAKLANEGKNFANITINLGADVDLAGIEWTPIGLGKVSADGITEGGFLGTFDGKGHVIDNLTTAQASGESVEANAGLFAVVGGTIKNLTLSDVNISGNTDTSKGVGAVAAAVYGGAIENVIVTSGSVSGYKGVGGIAGRIYADGIIKDSVNYATVNGYSVGGIIGQAYYSREGKSMLISGCTNYGNVTGLYSAGGITSLTCGSVTNCDNYGDVAGGTIVGGIVAENCMGGTTTDCVNRGDIKGNTAGGIVGWTRYNENTTNYNVVSVINVSGNTNYGSVGAIDNETGSISAGGIVGTAYVAAAIRDNVNYATAIGSNVNTTFAGGIVGNVQHIEDNNAYGVTGWAADFAENDIRITGNTSYATTLTGECKDPIAYINSPQYLTEWFDNYTVTADETRSQAFHAKSVYVRTAEQLAEETGKAADYIVKLSGDITLASAFTVDNAAGVTIDLNCHDLTADIVNNGKLTVTDTSGTPGTVTNVSGHTIINNGTLTVDKVTVDNVTHAGAAIVNNVGATFTLASGTLTRSQEAGASKTDNGGNSFYVLQNFGDVTIKDGTVMTNGGKYSSLITNGWYNGAKDNPGKKAATMTIENGTFSGGLNTIKNDDFGKLTINGGTFTNFSQAAVFNVNELTINDGTIDGTSAEQAIYTRYYDDVMDKGMTTINGGTITGKIVAVNGATLNITGGTFVNTNAAVLCLVDGATGNISGGDFDFKLGADKEYNMIQLGSAEEAGATLNVTGGTFVSEGYGFVVLSDSTLNYGGTASTVAAWPAIGGNNLNPTMTVNITGGTLESKEDAVIYMPSDGELNITGGKLTGPSILDVRMGTAKIAVGGDAELTATAAQWTKLTLANTSGATKADGSVFILNTNRYGNNVAGSKPTLNFTIGENVKITAASGRIVTVYDWNVVEQDCTFDFGNYEAKYYEYIGGYVYEVTVDNGVKYALVSDYNEMQSAINAGVNVRLTKDIATDKSIIVNSKARAYEGLIIDLGGNTVTSTNSIGSPSALEIAAFDTTTKEVFNNINLTVKNGTLTGDNSVWYGIGVFSYDNVTLTLENVKAIGTDGGICAQGVTKGAKITATNCYFEGNGTYDPAGAYLPGNNEYNFNACTFKGYDGVYMKSGNYIYTGCTFISTGEFKEAAYNGSGSISVGCAMAVDSAQGYQTPLVVEVNGGTFESADGYGIIEFSTSKNAAITPYANVTVTGDVTFKCAKGNVLSKNGLVSAEVATADQLNAAINAGYTTVKLTNNITDNVVVNSGTEVTLDLNGFTLKSNAASKATIENYGSLTVVDTGSAKGKITRESTNWYVIVNEGEMTLNGIVVENTNVRDTSSLIINNKDCVAASPANLTIESGTFASAGSNAVKNDDYGVLTVNGGTFTTDGAKVAAIQNWATATINGGDFSGFKQAIAVQVYGGQTNTTLITDGKFGTPAAIYIGNGFEEQSLSKGTINLKITGGTFNGNVTTSSVNTILPTDKIDLGTYAGEIVLYADSEGSLKAATAFNAKVVLVSDFTMAEVITVGADNTLTLDFNGHTVSYNSVNADRPVQNYGKLTIKNGLDNSIEEGKGGISSLNAQTYGIIDCRPGSTTNIYGGYFATDGVSGYAILRIRQNTEVNIYNGAFVANEYDSAVYNEGKLFIHDGHFYTNSSNRGSWAYCVINATGGDLTIDNATVRGIQGGIAVSGGTAVINNCDVEARDRIYESSTDGSVKSDASFYALYVAGEYTDVSCIVNGGKFVASNMYALRVGNTNTGGDGGLNLNAHIEINGGTFDGKKGAIGVDKPLGTAIVYGGTFNTNPADGDDLCGTKLLSEGYITVVNEIDGRTFYTVYESLAAAIAVNDVVTLASDVTVDEAVLVAGGGNKTLNLNGYDITASANNKTGIFLVEGTLTINGDETSTVYGGSGGDNTTIWAKGGTVNIYGGNYSVGGDANGLGNSCVYAAAGGKVNIYGGTFSSEKTYQNRYYVLNCQNNTGSKINVYGGTFVNYNPADGDDNDGTQFLANGCVAVESENAGAKTYTVYESLPAAVSSITERSAVYFTAGEYDITDSGLNIKNHNVSLIGAVDQNGNPATVLNLGNAAFRYYNEATGVAYESAVLRNLIIKSNAESDKYSVILGSNNFVIDNCRFDTTGSGVSLSVRGNGTLSNSVFSGGGRNLGTCYANNGDVTIQNCTFGGAVYGVHFDGGTGRVLIKDCDIAGWNSFASTLANVSVEGSTFSTARGYNYLRTYAPLQLTNCNFGAGFKVSCVKPVTVTVTNCEGIRDVIDTSEGGVVPGSTWIIDGKEESGESIVRPNVFIASAEELYALNDLSDNMLTGKSYNVYLTKDIDLSGLNVAPGGQSDTGSPFLVSHFNGVFDGQGHTIKGNAKYQYIFGYSLGDTEFKNVTVEFADSKITRLVCFAEVIANGASGDNYHVAAGTEARLTFDNVDYVASKNNPGYYYDFGNTGNRALYYNDNCTALAAYYQGADNATYFDETYVGGDAGKLLPFYITIKNCDVSANFTGANHTSGAAIFLGGQIYGTHVNIDTCSYSGDFVGEYAGIVFANGSGTSGFIGADGNWVIGSTVNGTAYPCDIVVENVTLNGTLNTVHGGITFGNKATECNGVTGGENVHKLVADSTLKVTADASTMEYKITAASASEAETYSVQLKMGGLDWYRDGSYAEKYVVTSDFTITVTVSDLANTRLYKATPLSLKQATEAGITTEAAVWSVSDDNYKYTFAENNGMTYLVIDFEANGLYRTFQKTDGLTSAKVFAYDAADKLVAMANET